MKKVLVNFHVSGGGGNNRKLKFVGTGTKIKDEVFNSDKLFSHDDGTLHDCGGNEIDFRDEEDGYFVEFDTSYDTSYGTVISSFDDLNDEEKKVCLSDSNAMLYLKLEGIEIPEEI